MAQRFHGRRAGLQNGFRQFEFDATRWQAELLEQILKVVGKALIHELPRRHIDSNPCVRPLAVVPTSGGFNGFPQYPVAHFNDEPGFFRDREELGRRCLAAVGKTPANQGFDQHHLQ